MELEITLTELQPFRLNYVLAVSVFFTVRYGVCVINPTYRFQWMFLKLCRHIADLMKICTWGFDGDSINF